MRTELYSTYFKVSVSKLGPRQFITGLKPRYFKIPPRNPSSSSKENENKFHHLKPISALQVSNTNNLELRDKISNAVICHLAWGWANRHFTRMAAASMSKSTEKVSAAIYENDQKLFWTRDWG